MSERQSSGLPSSTESRSAPEPTEAPGQADHPDSQRQSIVLVADDEAPVVNLVAIALEEEGYRVLKAYDGTEALALACREAPDLILINIMMPGLGGLEVRRDLEGDAPTTKIPVILMSAIDRVDLGLNRDAPFLAKPFTLDHMIALIQAHLPSERTSVESASVAGTPADQ